MIASECQNLIHNLLLLTRRVHTCIINPKFTTLFEQLSEQSRIELKQHIANLDVVAIERQLRTAERLELELMNMRRLRDIAKDYGILYYYVLTRTMLITAIRRHEDEINRTTTKYEENTPKVEDKGDSHPPT